MFAPWLVLLAALNGEGAPELRAAAAVTPRPQLCQPARGVWARARAHSRLQRCRVLAKALNAVEREPKTALQLASSLARTELETEALVVTARAHLALGDAQRAWADFSTARARSVNVLAEPLARHDAALAAARAGDAQAAAALYRTLVAEREFLPRTRRLRALLEAALAVLRLGPDHAEEAVEYLRLGISLGERPERERDRAMYAFAQQRTAAPEPALELKCPAESSVQNAPSSAFELLPQFEEHALIALACERSDPARAREQWQSYAAAAGAAPWSAWANKRTAQDKKEP